MVRLALICAIACSAKVALADQDSLSQSEVVQGFLNEFISVCFDTNWTTEDEGNDLKFLGFERIPGESLRRRYRLGSLYLASFLAREDSQAGKPVCTLATRSASAGVLRKSIEDWDFAGAPLEDKVIQGSRYTMWRVKYRRHSGDVLMEEESDRDGTTVHLSLMGD